MAIFDSEGSLAGEVHWELPGAEQLLEEGDRAAVFEDNYEGYLQRAVRVTPGLIRVKAFCLPESELAVYELPECLLEFQDDPSNPNTPDEEREWLQGFFQRWKAGGQFVLLWGNDYWLDGSGEVVAS